MTFVNEFHDILFSKKYPFNTNEGKLMRGMLYTGIILVVLVILNGVFFPR